MVRTCLDATHGAFRLEYILPQVLTTPRRLPLLRVRATVGLSGRRVTLFECGNVSLCIVCVCARARACVAGAQWKRRGIPVFAEAERCVRVTQEDRAMGFFVACLVRSHDKAEEKDASHAPHASLEAACAAEEEESHKDNQREVVDEIGGQLESKADKAAQRRAPSGRLSGQVPKGTTVPEPAHGAAGDSIPGKEGARRGSQPRRPSVQRAAQNGRGLRGGVLLKRHFARGFGRSAFY